MVTITFMPTADFPPLTGSIVISSTSGISYQWQKGGEDIAAEGGGVNIALTGVWTQGCGLCVLSDPPGTWAYLCDASGRLGIVEVRIGGVFMYLGQTEITALEEDGAQWGGWLTSSSYNPVPDATGYQDSHHGMACGSN